MNSDNFYAQIHLTMTNIYIKKRLFSRPRSNDTHSLFVATSCYWYGYVKRRTTVFFCQLIIMVVKIMMKTAHWSSTRICCDWFWKIERPLLHKISSDATLIRDSNANPIHSPCFWFQIIWLEKCFRLGDRIGNSIFQRIRSNNNSFETAHRRDNVTGLWRCIGRCHQGFMLTSRLSFKNTETTFSLFNLLFKLSQKR